MNKTHSNRVIFGIMLLMLLVMILVNISLGSVNIPIRSVLSSLITGQGDKETWNYIILNYRLPKAITAILVGSGLSVSGRCGGCWVWSRKPGDELNIIFRFSGVPFTHDRRPK